MSELLLFKLIPSDIVTGGDENLLFILLKEILTTTVFESIVDKFSNPAYICHLINQSLNQYSSSFFLQIPSLNLFGPSNNFDPNISHLKIKSKL